MSGFIGYLLIGLYLRRFVGELSWKKTLAIAVPSFLAGFGIGVFGFLRRVAATSGGVFPVEGPVGIAAQWETPWLNDTIGVALMAIGWLLVFRKIKADGGFYRSVVLPVSKAGYGMYLSHLLVLVWVSARFRELGWATPVQILCTAAVSFVLVALCCVALQRIPKVGKYIIG